MFFVENGGSAPELQQFKVRCSDANHRTFACFFMLATASQSELAQRREIDGITAIPFLPLLIAPGMNLVNSQAFQRGELPYDVLNALRCQLHT